MWMPYLVTPFVLYFTYISHNITLDRVFFSLATVSYAQVPAVKGRKVTASKCADWNAVKRATSKRISCCKKVLLSLLATHTETREKRGRERERKSERNLISFCAIAVAVVLFSANQLKANSNTWHNRWQKLTDWECATLCVCVWLYAYVECGVRHNAAQ